MNRKGKEYSPVYKMWVLFSMLYLVPAFGYAQTTTSTSGSSKVEMVDFMKPIIELWCYFAGQKELAAILAGIAIVGLIIMFIVDEGGSYISTALRIMLGAAILISLPALVSQIFGTSNFCRNSSIQTVIDIPTR